MEQFIVEDLEPVQLEVPIQGKKYLLRQASDGAAIKWRQFMMSGATIDPATNRPVPSLETLSRLAEADSYLVSLCMFAEKKGGGYETSHIDLSVVQQWLSPVVSKLVRKIKEITPELEQAPPKNDGSAGTGSSD